MSSEDYVDNGHSDNFNITKFSNAGPVVDDYDEFYNIASFITGLILYPSICLPGLFGNALTLIVLTRQNMKTSTNAFLSALAVSDAIKLINDVLYFIVMLLTKTEPMAANWAYAHFYPHAHFIFNMSACVSSWLTVSVAVERYIMVCHPTRARGICSRTRAIVTSSIVYIVMTIVAIPSGLRYRTIQVVDPHTNITIYDVSLTDLWKIDWFVSSYTWLQTSLRCLIPLLVLVVMNTCIINALRKTRANKKISSRHRVTMMMIIVIVVFMVCITPDAVMSTFLRLGYREEKSKLVRGIREFTDTLLTVNAAVNFVIYCLFNKLFRQNFIHLFCKKRFDDQMSSKQLDETQYRRLSEPSGLLNNHQTKSSL